MSRTTWAVEGQEGTVLEVDGRRFGASDDGAPMLVNNCFSSLDLSYAKLLFSVQWFAVIWAAIFTLIIVVPKMQLRAPERIYNTFTRGCCPMLTVLKILRAMLFTGGEQVGWDRLI